MRGIGLWLLLIIGAATSVLAEDVPLQPGSGGGLVARINLEAPNEVWDALVRAESYFQNNSAKEYPPIDFVIHGPEVAIFYRQNYATYKPIVDLAARLSALGVIDVKVCQTSSRELELEGQPKYPFVGEVPFGPAEIRRLLERERHSFF